MHRLGDGIARRSTRALGAAPASGSRRTSQNSTTPGPPARSVVPPEGYVPHGLLESPEGRQVLGRAPCDEAGAVAEAADLDRHRLDEFAGQAPKQFDREPGEPGASCQRDEASGAEAQHRHEAFGPGAAKLRQDRGERRAGIHERGGRRPVVVDPRVAREILRGDGSGEQRVIAPGDDAGGHVEEPLAPEELGQRLARVDAAAVEFALAAREAAQPLGARGGYDAELDGREGLPEAGGRAGEHGLGPWRGCGDAEDAGASRPGGGECRAAADMSWSWNPRPRRRRSAAGSARHTG